MLQEKLPFSEQLSLRLSVLHLECDLQKLCKSETIKVSKKNAKYENLPSHPEDPKPQTHTLQLQGKK